jgi:2-iminobutanoate/2-iminopropanoate deaminase
MVSQRESFASSDAPPPAGTYSVAVKAKGLVFLAGQTPRDVHNVRHGDKPFDEQARLTLQNLEAAANAAGLSLKDAVKVNVFLKRPSDAQAFDAVYAMYVGDPPPARTLVQSTFIDFDIEIDAILDAGDG